MSLLNPYAGHHKLETLFSRGVDFTNCVLYAPLWHPRSKVSPFVSFDKTGHSITVTGAVWTPPYGRTLDGTDDYLQLADTGAGSSLNFTSQDFSIEVVLKCTLAVSYGLILSRGQTLVGGYNLAIDSAGIIYFTTRQLVADQVSEGTGFAMNSYWHLIVARQGAVAKIYRNAVEVTSVSASHINPVSYTAAAIIGRWDFTPSNYYKGIISELKVNSSFLTQSEVTQHYLAAKRRMPWANLP